MSTFFLNNHWFLDKTGRTGSTTQLVNGVFLLLTFLGVRLVYGCLLSFDFLRTLVRVRNQVPFSYLVVYGLGNIVLQGLNWFWFYKMIESLRRRFSADAKECNKLAVEMPGDVIDHGHQRVNDYGTTSK